MGSHGILNPPPLHCFEFGSSWPRPQHYLEAVQNESHSLHEFLKSQNKLRPEATYEDNNLMKEVLKFSESSYNSTVTPSLTLPKELGNSYCGSLYTGLLSLVTSHAENPQQGALAPSTTLAPLSLFLIPPLPVCALEQTQARSAR